MGSLLGKGDAAVVSEYFDGKVVWVTGASGGLGEALCVALCQASRPKGLVLSSRNQAELERVRSQCLQLRPELEVNVVPADLADVDSLPGIAERVQQSVGFVDVLVNNGGRGYRDLAKYTPVEVDRQMMNVNYFSGVALVKALLPQWVEQSRGHVVQVSSVQGFFGLPGRTAYSATKHAAVGFYDSLRAETADQGISVTVVAPGYIATNHSKNAAHGAGGKYPEGHTSKAVAPEVMAPQVLAAVARRRPEFVPAALDAKVAKILRAICPGILFWIMRRRARKETAERQVQAASSEPATKPLKAA